LTPGSTHAASAYLVGVLGIDVVFDRGPALLGEVLWRDLDEIGNLGLRMAGVSYRDGAKYREGRIGAV
jgi:hypothetical protein